MSALSGKKLLTQAEEILRLLSSALRSRTLYPEKHPVIQLNAKRLLDLFRTFHETEDSWSIVLLGGEFVFQKIPLPKVGNIVRSMFREMKDRRIEAITVQKGVTQKELFAFIGLLLEGKDIWTGNVGVTELLAGRKITHIGIKHVDIGRTVETESTDTGQARDFYTQAKMAINRLFVSVSDESGSVTLEEVDKAAGRLLDALESDRFAVLSRIHTRHDPNDLAAHCLNTGILAFLAIEQMGGEPELQREVMLAGFLHDIGLMDSPPRIDKGFVRRSADQTVYAEHPIRGLAVLRNIPGVPTAAEVAAFEHHMRWDASGFPNLDKPGKMHAVSTAVAIGSAYDLYLHAEDYIAPEEIPQLLTRSTDTEFEGRILAHFLVAVGAFPPGTYVKLTSNDVGVVIRTGNEEVFRPIIKVMVKADGQKVSGEEFIDLTKRDPRGGNFLISISSSVKPENAPNFTR